MDLLVAQMPFTGIQKVLGIDRGQYCGGEPLADITWFVRRYFLNKPPVSPPKPQDSWKITRLMDSLARNKCSGVAC